MTKMNDYSFCFSSLLNLSKIIIIIKNKENNDLSIKIVLLQVIAYWIQANKESLNEKKATAR